MRRRLCYLFLTNLILPGAALGHGALAIGVPDSVASDGIAMGYAWNMQSADIARVDALRACLDLKNVPPKARGLCRVVTTFSRQCMSLATDHPGGAGWGWAVEPTLAQAQGRALSSCKSTVARSCVIAASHCDERP